MQSLGIRDHNKISSGYFTVVLSKGKPHNLIIYFLGKQIRSLFSYGVTYACDNCWHIALPVLKNISHQLNNLSQNKHIFSVITSYKAVQEPWNDLFISLRCLRIAVLKHPQ